uniref:CSON010888 protein n=1 Tax=Culicoides sonorensis TaxID=179676 RepID=A0A336M2R4_CULSO
MLLGAVFGILVFVIFLGGYFFFRDVCCSRYKEYMYNPLNDDDQDMGRQTINKNSAVAFKKEIQNIINDDSTSSDEETSIYTARRYDNR